MELISTKTSIISIFPYSQDWHEPSSKRGDHLLKSLIPFNLRVVVQVLPLKLDVRVRVCLLAVVVCVHHARRPKRDRVLLILLQPNRLLQLNIVAVVH